MIQLYGIPNCDTVKKARRWLDENAIVFEFVDFKKSPPSEDLIRKWLTQIPLETLINKRGTSWRKLSPQEQASAESADAAVLLLMEKPSLIKRPLLNRDGQYSVGFSAESYQNFFA